MDWEAFEQDVWESINDCLWSRQWGTLDDSDPTVEYTGLVYSIGETWQGTLYGAAERTSGSNTVRMFDTEDEQRKWFNALTED